MIIDTKLMLNRWPIVYIEWQDHDADGSWVGEEDDEGDIETVSSVGWLFKETPDAYVLIGNQGPQKQLVGNKQRILKKLVTKCLVLSARPKKPKETKNGGKGDVETKGQDPR